jgi:hypothetical protein
MALDEHAIPTFPTHQEVAQDVLERYRVVDQRYWRWVSVLTLLFVAGIVGFILRLNDGFGDEARSNWGYLVATLSFLLSTFLAMPILSAGLRLAKANWRRPFTRINENMAITGLLIYLMLIPALLALPDTEGRLSIWFEFPHWMAFKGANLMVWGTLVLIGLSLLWLVALPDLAAVRDHVPNSRRARVTRFLSLGWTGSLRQWRVLHSGALLFGAFFLLLYPTTQTLMQSDFQAGLLPGIKDAIAPATAIINALQGAVALTLVVMYVMRRFGGYERYFGIDQFWSLSKPLLAFSLLWFYFWWASFITFWYGRQPGESELLKLLILDSYRNPLMISFFLNFIGPLVALVWNPVRKSIWGPTLVASGILVGGLINHIRWYVSAFSVTDPGQHVLSPIPPGQLPTASDALIVVGGISGCILLFMLISKLIPVISIWEVGEGLHLVKVRKFFGRYVVVIAKSH